MNISIFIPGRLKSERLPGKLILPIGNTCLWEIACEKLSKLPDAYGKAALCHDQKLVEIARRHGVEVVLRDQTTTELDGPNHVIFKDVGALEADFYMFLNPCLAFLRPETILSALELFQKQEVYESATSVKPFKNWLYDGNRLLTRVDQNSWSTKSVKGYFQAAHSFHIFSHKLLFMKKKMLEDEHLLIEVPEVETLDVDTKESYDFMKWTWEHVHR